MKQNFKVFSGLTTCHFAYIIMCGRIGRARLSVNSGVRLRYFQSLLWICLMKPVIKLTAIKSLTSSGAFLFAERKPGCWVGHCWGWERYFAKILVANNSKFTSKTKNFSSNQLQVHIIIYR